MPSRNLLILWMLLIFSGLAGCQTVPVVREEVPPAAVTDLNLPEALPRTDSPFSDLIARAFSEKSPSLSYYENQAHYLRMLNTGEDAFLARLHMVRHAQRAIYIQSYIWRADASGKMMIQELIAAARRGVKVKVLIDKLGSFDDPRLISYFALADPNIEIKFYNPSAETLTPSALAVAGEILLQFNKFNHRMHNKTFIMDDRIAIIGGRNVGDEYFDMNPGINFKDRDVLIIGPIVPSITRSFAEYWHHPLSFATEEFRDVDDTIRNRSHLNYAITDDILSHPVLLKYLKAVEDPSFIRERFVDTISPVGKLMFTFDRPGKNFAPERQGFSRTPAHLAAVLSQARTELLIQTPYFVLEDRLFKAAHQFRRSHPGLDVTLSTNSLAATDSIYTYAYTFKRKAEYIRKLKLRIFEFKPVPGDIRTLVPNYDWLKELVESEDPPEAQERDPISFFSENPHMCIHAKSFVVDGAIAWIGTSNLDPRSIHLNSELGLTVWDKDFAGKLKKDIERDIDSRNSWAVGLVEPTSFWTPLSNAIGSAVNLFPFVDLWPFSEISLYELKEGGEPVPFFHPDFYDNYKSVGPFPEVELTLKEIRLRFLKPIMIYAEPII